MWPHSWEYDTSRIMKVSCKASGSYFSWQHCVTYETLVYVAIDFYHSTSVVSLQNVNILQIIYFCGCLQECSKVFCVELEMENAFQLQNVCSYLASHPVTAPPSPFQ